MDREIEDLKRKMEADPANPEIRKSYQQKMIRLGRRIKQRQKTTELDFREQTLAEAKQAFDKLIEQYGPDAKISRSVHYARLSLRFNYQEIESDKEYEKRLKKEAVKKEKALKKKEAVKKVAQVKKLMKEMRALGLDDAEIEKMVLKKKKKEPVSRPRQLRGDPHEDPEEEAVAEFLASDQGRESEQPIGRVIHHEPANGLSFEIGNGDYTFTMRDNGQMVFYDPKTMTYYELRAKG